MFQFKTRAALFLILALYVSGPVLAFAAGFQTNPTDNQTPSVLPTAQPTVTGSSDSSVNCGQDTLCNPLGANSVCGLIKDLLNAALVIGIPIAVLFIIYAGFRFVTAQGSPTGLAEARKNFLNTLIGIAIFVGASLIATVIINTMAALGVQGIVTCL